MGDMNSRPSCSTRYEILRRARSHGVRDLALDLRQHLTSVEDRFTVNFTSAAPFDREHGGTGAERRVPFGRSKPTAGAEAIGTSDRPMGWRRNVSAMSAWQRAHAASPTYLTPGRVFNQGECGHEAAGRETCRSCRRK